MTKSESNSSADAPSPRVASRNIAPARGRLISTATAAGLQSNVAVQRGQFAKKEGTEMRLLRDVATYLALFGLVAVSLASGIQVYRQGLDDPDRIDQSELVDWLSRHDVAAEPRETKLRLVHRMERDFKLGVDWQEDIDALEPARWDRFQSNFKLLMQIWLMEKVDRFFEIEDVEREEFLDTEIANLMAWRPVDQRDARNGARQWMRIDTLHEQLQEWIRDASRDDRRRMSIFLQAVQGRMLERALERMTMPNR